MKNQYLASAAMALCLALPAIAADGEAVYAKKCAKCHGDDGKGDTKIGKKLKIEDLTAKVGKLSDAKLEAAVTEGVVEDGKKRMKPIKGLSAEEVAAVVAYMKTLK